MNSLLYVAYPLLPVSDESAGGAEQMLATLEREMAARGCRTAVAACAGSTVTGEVIETGEASDELDHFEAREVEHNLRTIEEISSRSTAGESFDLVHDKSGSFWHTASAIATPVLATLHLPRSFYRSELFSDISPNVYFNCVSDIQARDFADLPRMMGVVRNGISLERFPFTPEKCDYLLWMGRICEEKGTHTAIAAAVRSRMPLVLAGQVYPFSYHRKYYEERVRPHLRRAGPRLRFVDTPLFEQKVHLLRNARAVLVPSLAEETSSLISMEAMACGTPVIAFRRGAIPEVVVDGETGFLVDTPEQMADAVADLGSIDPGVCRQRVESLYSAERMADDYEKLYQRVLADAALRRVS
jgi:glycosyltransferase involved in cell wall biosynthesis